MATSRRMEILGRIPAWGVLVAVTAGAFFASCRRAEAGSDTAPGVLIIAIDGLRADHVGCYGYDRPTTPTLDRLAEDGLLFEEAYTNSPSLLPAHVSLLTGCEPFVARRLPTEIDFTVERRWHVPEAVPHLAVEFLAHGYETAAFVDHPYLAPVFGFPVGFERYVQSDHEADSDEGRAGADYLTMQLVQWLRGIGRDEPWFAYLHLHDLERSWSRPHPRWERFFEERDGMDDVPPVGATDSVLFAIPYSRWRGGSRSLGEYEAQYDGHLRGLDDDLERLFGSLDTTGRYDSTTIVVVGSHGIQFGEAGLYLSGGRYSLADIHVPWILRPRQGLSEVDGGTVVRHLASLSDVAPTVLELAGLEPPKGTHGISHAGHVLGQAPGEPLRRFAYSSCGIQDGGVLVGPRLCYEFLLPGEAEDSLYRRSWFGEGEEHQRETCVRFYDRSLNPFPPLGELQREGTPEEFDAFKIAAFRWYDDMKYVRKILHATALFGDPVPPEKVKELQENGLLVEDL